MTTLQQEGGCQCGAVRYRTSDKPVRVLACHCQSCRRRTGAPYGVGLYFDSDDVEVVQGSMRTYEFRSSTSGRWVRNEFCEQCGTAVTWTLEMRLGLRGIASGTYDDQHWYKIDAHLWAGEARSDMCFPEHVEVFEAAVPAA